VLEEVWEGRVPAALQVSQSMLAGSGSATTGDRRGVAAIAASAAAACMQVDVRQVGSFFLVYNFFLRMLLYCEVHGV
jgi:hypothetical protein